jgi:hypothetical protein
VIINAARGEARVQVSRDRLAHAYHVRYELIELAALTLATRAQRLIPLHAACIAQGNRGVLILGDSGAGKSTLTLASVAAGLQVLAEDSVFVHPANGRATGVASFIHVRRDAVRHAGAPALRDRIRASPRIRRRSGARKFRFDLRGWSGAVAKSPVEVLGVIVLSARAASADSLLRRLGRDALAREMRRAQPYARQHPRWRDFERRMLARGGFRLSRGKTADETAQAVRRLLLQGRIPETTP